MRFLTGKPRYKGWISTSAWLGNFHRVDMSVSRIIKPWENLWEQQRNSLLDSFVSNPKVIKSHGRRYTHPPLLRKPNQSRSIYSLSQIRPQNQDFWNLNSIVWDFLSKCQTLWGSVQNWTSCRHHFLTGWQK